MTIVILLLLVAAAAAAGIFIARRRPRLGAALPVACAVSLLAALCLYWLALAAITGRVHDFWALFTFFGDGWAGTARAGLLCASAALCLMLGLTERGERLRRRLDGALRKTGALWLAAGIVTALFFLWTIRVTVMSYMTNDDVYFMQAIARVPALGSGAVTNTLAHSAQENTESISLLLCVAIGQLYKLSPDVLWYLGYHLAVLFVSITVIGRCLLGKFRARGLSPLAGCAVHAALCAGVFMFSLAEIAFTVTSAIAGTAAAALMLCLDAAAGPGARRAMGAGSAVLLLLCFLQRRATGTCVICFWALAAVYQLVRILLTKEPARRRKIASLACTAALSLALVAAGLYIPLVRSDSAYDEAEYYRSLIGDYISHDLTMEQYERAGIPRELAVMIHGWYFMDERVTTESFRELAEIYYADEAAVPPAPLGERVASGLRELGAQIAAEPQMYVRVGIAAGLALVCLASLLRYGKRNWLPCLTALCTIGGAALLLLWVVMNGRFYTRVFLIVADPAIVLLLLLGLTAPADAEGTPGRLLPAALAALGGVTALVFCALSVFAVPYAAEDASRDTVFADQWTVEAYLDAHRDITYITNRYGGNLDPLHSPVYPENLVLWGGVGDIYHPAEERLFADTFFRDDVRAMLRSPGSLPFLLQYLSLDFGPVRALDEEHVDAEAFVYDISAIAPEGTDGWYEWGGMWYYYVDGVPVTGTRVIDGVTYEFNAPGAEAHPVVVTTDEGVYYTTTAYARRED